MRLLTSFITFALIGLLVAAPATDVDDEPLEITNLFFGDEFVLYRSKYDIVSIVVPLNSLNFDESDSSESDSSETDSQVSIFFVEADIQSDGTREYKGLYVLKDEKATKILENGRDAAASADESKLVFLGAADGLYVYNQKTNSADKYGSITDSIIAMAKEKTGDVIYILTEDRDVYKVTDSGEKKEKLDDVVKAKEIVLDTSNNLYFYSDDKKPYVRTADGVKAIEGLPEELSNVRLIKPPFILDDAVPFLGDDKVYLLYSNGTSEPSDIYFKSKDKPTAYAPEATLVQFYAVNKKIYLFNILSLLMEASIGDLSKYLNAKADDIKVLASKTKTQAARTKAAPKA